MWRATEIVFACHRFDIPDLDYTVANDRMIIKWWIVNDLEINGHGLEHYSTGRQVKGSIPDEIIGFFIWPNPSSLTMALGSIRPLTEMSTRNLPGGKWRPARKAGNLTTICEPIIYKMWEPRRLTTLWASTACYSDTFSFLRSWLIKALTQNLRKDTGENHEKPNSR
jgi:hypothetical protein